MARLSTFSKPVYDSNGARMRRKYLRVDQIIAAQDAQCALLDNDFDEDVDYLAFKAALARLDRD